MKGYYFITDSLLSKNGNLNDCKNAINAGVETIQYRSKNKNSFEMYEEAKTLKEICKKTNFIINDRIDIALAINADGVHLGQKDLPYKIARKLLGNNKIIGISVSSIEEAETAYNVGASYLGVGPIFMTSTKSDAEKPVGLELIKEIKKKFDSKIPIVAIGGINLENAKDVIFAGADSICAISDVVTKCDVKKEIKKYQELFR
ncbi:MAG: thiamine phosphate synthase [Elusimicrobiota bacterium]|jgi:thiamine-phosphate pyrophosphorylase|nr:thiamine phosphate synthase [Elusimicrobiota bacterium]